MNAIISIKPQYVDEILAGRKRFEYRKRVFARPVEKVYIYASSPVSKVVGEFEIANVIEGHPEEIWEKTKQYSGIRKTHYDRYFEGRKIAYAIEIKNMVKYEKNVKLPIRAPQSYCYVDRIY